MKNNKLLYTGSLACLAALSIYGINKSINVAANSHSTLANGNGFKYEWRFGNIFYTKQGSGKPVLLIHDLTCGSSDIEWKYLVRQYAKTNTVYTMDLLGCGRSDKPSMTYTNYLYVQLVTDFVKNVIGHRTDVVVSGASSSFVLMACFNDDTIFDKLTLINPQHISLNNTAINHNLKFIKSFIELPVIGTLTYNIATTKQSFLNQFKCQYLDNPYAVKRNLVNAYYDAAHFGTGSSKYLFASICSNYTLANVSRAVKNINNSIYIIGGSSEPYVNDIINEYTKLNPSIEYILIEGTKHLPQLEKPANTLAHIKIFSGCY